MAKSRNAKRIWLSWQSRNHNLTRASHQKPGHSEIKDPKSLSDRAMSRKHPQEKLLRNRR